MALLSGSLLVLSTHAGAADSPARADSPTSDGPQTLVENIDPFTHLAYLPANANPATVRFEKIKLVNVSTRMVRTAGDCGDSPFAEPGGSSGCTEVRPEANVPAYEATYSYAAPAMASDEQGESNFSFRVRFRPDELTAAVQRAITQKKVSRPEAAAYFAVTSHRETMRSVAIDLPQSRFCAGSFVDGVWTHTRPACQDSIAYRTVTSPSGYLTVKVEPVSPATQSAALVSAARSAAR